MPNNHHLTVEPYCVFKHQSSNAAILIKGNHALAALEHLKLYVSNTTEWRFTKVTFGYSKVT